MICKHINSKYFLESRRMRMPLNTKDCLLTEISIRAAISLWV